MRLYKISAKSNDESLAPRSVWVGSKAEGVTARKEFLEAGFVRRELTEEAVDVPTNKDGLLVFLNDREVA